MAYALVGALGAVSVGSNNTSLTPAWNAGASRTAGNLLVCWLAGFHNTAVPTPATPSGWSPGLIAKVAPGNAAAAADVFYKLAAGADAAPTFVGVSGTSYDVMLAEFSGNFSTGDPTDQTGIAQATNSPAVVAGASTDLTSGELVIYAASENTTIAVGTMVGTPNNWTKNDVSNNATSIAKHYLFGWGTTTSNTAADSDSIVFDVAASNCAASLISFKLPGAAPIPDLIMAPMQR